MSAPYGRCSRCGHPSLKDGCADPHCKELADYEAEIDRLRAENERLAWLLIEAAVKLEMSPHHPRNLLKRIDVALSPAPVEAEKETCPSCHGSRKITGADGRWQDCSECHGTGRTRSKR